VPVRPPKRFRKKLLAMSDDMLGMFNAAVGRLTQALSGLCRLPLEVEAEVPDLAPMPPARQPGGHVRP
jgi:hypothetical protein